MAIQSKGPAWWPWRDAPLPLLLCALVWLDTQDPQRPEHLASAPRQALSRLALQSTSLAVYNRAGRAGSAAGARLFLSFSLANRRRELPSRPHGVRGCETRESPRLTTSACVGSGLAIYGLQTACIGWRRIDA